MITRLEQVPPGILKRQIEGLPLSAQQVSLEWLRSFHFTDEDLDSLHPDAKGALYYACRLNVEGTPAEPAAPVIAAAAVPVNPFPASLTLHSRPGAPNVLYLNFAGEMVSDTAWNTTLGRTVIPALPFSTDADTATFSDAEQAAIRAVWLRVSEDYAPFNIDVTTERPAVFTLRTAHAIITRNTDANGEVNPSSTAGGVAYVNVFNASYYPSYRPAWVYANNLANTDSYIAEAASHEIGHNMGLSHDGITGGSQYYGGHGSGDISWGTIMGTGYNRNVSQWSKGDYYLANNSQDDLAVIAAKIAYLADDHGDTTNGATALVISGGTNLVSTTPSTDPARTNSANKGVLERNTDVDVFSFETGAGAVKLAVDPWIMPSGTRGGNLDILLELVDGSGQRLATNNPASLTTALIQTNLAAGTYFLVVRNTGAGSPLAATPTGFTSYGSIGQYFIRGTVAVRPVPPQVTATAAVPYAWLATYGYTNYECDVVRTGCNGVVVWESFVAGLNPTNPQSQFLIQGEGTPAGAGFKIRWSTIPDRHYTVLASTNLMSGFVPLPGASDLPPAVTDYTDPYTQDAPARFYRVLITRP